ncbi:MAG: Glutaconyl-CoA decarboxylase subunit gamma [Chloroflexi bacterium]|nr:Glutaconyl-CoA decarboxylase subunit gamma [Chloroflexota bacterium]
MSQYNVMVGEREYKVKMTDAGVVLNGQLFHCDLKSLDGNGLHQLKSGKRLHNIYLSAKSSEDYEVLIEGRRALASVIPAHRQGRRRKNGAKIGDLKAAMPGLIVDVLVKKGDWVEKGDVLVIQEAMKMQMQMRAPRAGCVNLVAVESGAQVEKNDLLARVTE